MVMIHVVTLSYVGHLHNDRIITHTATILQGLQQIFCISQVLQLIEETEVCGRVHNAWQRTVNNVGQTLPLNFKEALTVLYYSF